MSKDNLSHIFFDKENLEAKVNKIFANAKEWLTVRELAILLKKFTKDGKPSLGAIRNMVWRRKIPFYKPFGRLLFKKSEVEAFIESSRKGGFNVCTSI